LSIAHRLNAERVPFPTKATKRGPARKGWSNVTVRFILRNERYTGRVVWNKREFLKDPDSGKRRSVLRPASEWRVEDRPDLRIVPPDLDRTVADRIKMLGSSTKPAGTSHWPSASSWSPRPCALRTTRTAACR
jgi:site-specific DNA recombinase